MGVDVSKDNIINRMDGACARYLSTAKKTAQNNMPGALFVNGDSSKNLKSGEALFNDTDRMIVDAVFGKGTKDVNKLGKGVYKNYGVGKDGFDVCSIQFAIHYMFENMYKLTNFLRNVSETTKVGGYFIATCYDGRTIFNDLASIAKGKSEVLYSNDDNKKIWSITKQYYAEEFLDDEPSVGYAIDVYQESINKTFREYLVNYKYLNRLLNDYGFTLITNEEAKKLNLPSGSDMFKTLYTQMMEESKKDADAKRKYGDAMEMNRIEKEISFLNRYFVYRKTHDVDTSQITNILMKNVNVEVAADADANAVDANAKVETKKVGVYNDNNKYTDTTQYQFVPFKGDIDLMSAKAKSSDDVEMYSITKPRDAENMSYMIYEDNKEAPYGIYDGTTSIGGNFIPFINDYLGKSKSKKVVIN